MLILKATSTSGVGLPSAQLTSTMLSATSQTCRACWRQIGCTAHLRSSCEQIPRLQRTICLQMTKINPCMYITALVSACSKTKDHVSGSAHCNKPFPASRFIENTGTQTFSVHISSLRYHRYPFQVIDCTAGRLDKHIVEAHGGYWCEYED